MMVGVRGQTSRSIVKNSKAAAMSETPSKKSFDRDSWLKKALDVLFSHGSSHVKVEVLARELDKYVLTTAYSVPLLWTNRIVVMPKVVQGWNFTPTHYLSQDLTDVWLNR